MSTKDKRNAYNIRSRVDQAIFKRLLVTREKWSVLGKFDRIELSNLSRIATEAVMKDERLNVVLKKEKP